MTPSPTKGSLPFGDSAAVDSLGLSRSETGVSNIEAEELGRELDVMRGGGSTNSSFRKGETDVWDSETWASFSADSAGVSSVAMYFQDTGAVQLDDTEVSPGELEGISRAFPLDFCLRGEIGPTSSIER